MSSEFDPADFVDGDLQGQQTAAGLRASAAPGGRAPTREEVDARVVEAQQKLAELKRAQEELERERAALEETRRRQMEFQTGRQEMLQHLTRGLVLLEEAEFNARRDAEQMAKTLQDLREALAKVEAIREDGWTKENFDIELTRALTTLENARMEWNSARLKFQVLSGATPTEGATQAPSESSAAALLAPQNFRELCRVGLALTWPVAAVALAGVVILVIHFLRH
jgi:predicted nuclease with TOPRIM domain